jgi:hypothetical protein
VHAWFDRAPARVARDPPASPAPNNTTQQTLLIPARNENEERRGLIHNGIDQSLVDELLRTVEPRFRDAMLNSRAPTGTAPQTLLVPAGDEERSDPNQVVLNHFLVDELLRTVEPSSSERGARDAMEGSRASLSTAPSEVAALQAAMGGDRSPLGVTGHVRQELIPISHRRSGIGGQHNLRLCQNCGLVHDPPTTIIVFHPLSKKAVCFYILLLFLHFVFFFFGSRVSSKA